MPTPLPNATPRGRYSYEAMTEEIAKFLAEVGRGATADLADRLRLTSQQVSIRMRGVHSRFSYEQVGVAADWAGAEDGWPLRPMTALERKRLARAVQRRITRGA